MDTRHTVGLILVCLLSLLVLPALALNVWQLVRYLALSKARGPASGVAKAAWIISLAAWWTGPLLLIGSPLGIVLGILQLRSPSATSRLAGLMAVFNGFFIFAYAIALIGAVLWMIGKI